MLHLNDKKGFTLVELMIATMLSSFIMLVAVGALRAITATSERMAGTIDTASEARYAARAIETDLINIYRDSNSLNRRLVGRVIESGDGLITSLTFYAVGRTKARFDQPEGDVYEVEYYLLKGEQQSKLYRRLWPNPSKDLVPAGILTELVDNIETFSFRFFDGEAKQWVEQWSSDDLETLPDLVEINLVARAPLSNDLMAQTIVVNLKSNASALSTISAIEEAQQTEGTTTDTGTTTTGVGG
jgi:type II secretion system protein J